MGSGNICATLRLAEKKSGGVLPRDSPLASGPVLGYIFRLMKSLHLGLVAFLAVVCLTGCLQMEQVVKLKPDGSGSIEETVILTKAALASMQQMAAGFGGDKGGGGKVPDIFNEAKIKETAGKIGQGAHH